MRRRGGRTPCRTVGEACRAGRPGWRLVRGLVAQRARGGSEAERGASPAHRFPSSVKCFRNGGSFSRCRNRWHGVKPAAGLPALTVSLAPRDPPPTGRPANGPKVSVHPRRTQLLDFMRTPPPRGIFHGSRRAVMRDEVRTASSALWAVESSGGLPIEIMGGMVEDPGFRVRRSDSCWVLWVRWTGGFVGWLAGVFGGVLPTVGPACQRR